MSDEVYYPPSEIFQNKPTGFVDSISFRSRVVGRLMFPPEGGMELPISGMKYPMKGYPFNSPDMPIVDRVGDIKKVIDCAFRFLTKSPIRYFLPIFIFLPGIIRNKIIINALAEFAELSDQVLWRYYLEPKYFCRSGREIWRAGNAVIERNIKNQAIKGIFQKILLIVCMIWEFDTAYRYPGQDGLAEINQKETAKNPIKELLRIARIVIEREERISLKKRWQAMELIIRLLAIIRKLPTREMKEFFLELDIEKIRMDNGDLYYAYPKKGYLFGGRSYYENMKLRELL